MDRRLLPAASKSTFGPWIRMITAWLLLPWLFSPANGWPADRPEIEPLFSVSLSHELKNPEQTFKEVKELIGQIDKLTRFVVPA